MRISIANSAWDGGLMNRAFPPSLIALLLAHLPNSGNRICVTCCEEKYFEKLASFSPPKSVSPETTKHHKLTTKKPLKNHQKTPILSKTPCKNVIPRCAKNNVREGKEMVEAVGVEPVPGIENTQVADFKK